MKKGSNPKGEKKHVFPARWPVAAAERERVQAQPLTPRGTVGVPLRVAKPPVQPEEFLRFLRCLQFAMQPRPDKSGERSPEKDNRQIAGNVVGQKVRPEPAASCGVPCGVPSTRQPPGGSGGKRVLCPWGAEGGGTRGRLFWKRPR